MNVVMLIIGVLMPALALGWSLGRRRGNPSESNASPSPAPGFAALGLAFGMTLGLSNTPVLGTSIAAGFALIGTLLPAYRRQPEPGESGTSAQAFQTIPVGVWLFPFAVAMTLGMLIGIELRVNDALDLRGENLHDQLLRKGFTEQQTEQIMDRLAGSIDDVSAVAHLGPPHETEIASHLPTTETRHETGLQGAEGRIDWKGFWGRMGRLKASQAQILEALKKIAPASVLEEIHSLEAKKQSAESILKTVRHDHPEIEG
jgi:hypothetical protein